MASEGVLVRVSCPLCKRGGAEVSKAKNPKRSLYLKCAECNCIVFGHGAVSRYVDAVNDDSTGHVEFIGIDSYSWRDHRDG